MAIFNFNSGKTYSDVDTVRVTVGAPPAITGSNITTYALLNNPYTVPATSGQEDVLDERFIHDAANPWENPATTG